MKDKRFLVFISLLIIVVLAFLFFAKPVNKNKLNLRLQEAQNSDIAKLEAQIQQLSNLVHASGQTNLSLQKELVVQKEVLRQSRERRLELEQKLNDALTQSDALSKELEQAKSGLSDFEGLTAPIKAKLKEIDNSLAGSWLKPQQEKNFLVQLQIINKELDTLDHSIPDLVKENKSYKQKARSLASLADMKEGELVVLKKQLEQEKANKQPFIDRIKALTDELKMVTKNKSILEQKSQDVDKAIEKLKQENSFLNQALMKFEQELKEANNKQIESSKEKDLALSQKDDALKQKDLQLSQKEEELKKEKDLALSQKDDALKQKDLQLSQKEEALKKEKDLALSQKDDALKEKDLAIQQKEEVLKKQEEQQAKVILLTQANQELEKGIGSLKVELEKLNKDYAAWQSEQKNTQEIIKQHEAELGKRADKILVLQDKLSEMEVKLSEIQLKSKDMQKESALLREQYVVIQLEKENLKSQLEQTKLKLSNLQSQISQTIQLNANLQNQFQQINSILKTTEQPQGYTKEEPVPSAASKKVEVELYPQNKAEVKDEK